MNPLFLGLSHYHHPPPSSPSSSTTFIFSHSFSSTPLLHSLTPPHPLSFTPPPHIPFLFLIPSFLQLNDAMKDPRPLPPRHKAESSLKHWQEEFFFTHTLHPPTCFAFIQPSSLSPPYLPTLSPLWHCPPLHHLHFLLVHFKIHKFLLFYDMKFVPAFTKAACETGQANRQQVFFLFFYNPPASSLSIFIVITTHHQPSPPTPTHHRRPMGAKSSDSHSKFY